MKAPAGVTVLPGMTAIVTFAHRQAGAQGKGIYVPVAAVFKQDSGEQVAWVIGPDQVVSCRPVKMGAATDGQIEIVDGLHPGDRIVVAGTAFLRDGMKVRDLGDALGGGQP
jgi:multidrug efflux pump subunit AcrA (membrane-fusion protein)